MPQGLRFIQSESAWASGRNIFFVCGPVQCIIVIIIFNCLQCEFMIFFLFLLLASAWTKLKYHQVTRAAFTCVYDYFYFYSSSSCAGLMLPPRCWPFKFRPILKCYDFQKVKAIAENMIYRYIYLYICFIVARWGEAEDTATRWAI